MHVCTFRPSHALPTKTSQNHVASSVPEANIYYIDAGSLLKKHGCSFVHVFTVALSQIHLSPHFPATSSIIAIIILVGYIEKALYQEAYQIMLQTNYYKLLMLDCLHMPTRLLTITDTHSTTLHIYTTVVLPVLHCKSGLVNMNVLTTGTTLVPLNGTEQLKLDWYG